MSPSHISTVVRWIYGKLLDGLFRISTKFSVGNSRENTTYCAGKTYKLKETQRSIDFKNKVLPRGNKNQDSNDLLRWFVTVSRFRAGFSSFVWVIISIVKYLSRLSLAWMSCSISVLVYLFDLSIALLSRNEHALNCYAVVVISYRTRLNDISKVLTASH